MPRAFAFQSVTVKANVNRIEVAHQDQVVASHARSYERHAHVLDPLHYLVTLERKPATLDHSEVYRNWELPAAFARLRARLEGRHGSRTGARQFARVLQILAYHSAERVSRAIEICLAREHVEAALVAQHVERLAAAERAKERQPPSEPADRSDGDRVADGVLLPVSLKHFDQFLLKGETIDD